MNVYDKILDGDYRTNLEYPKKPASPAILNVRAKDLTQSEVAQIPSVKAEFTRATEAYHAKLSAYRADEARLLAQFGADLEAEFKMAGHPKARLLWSKAYDIGHSGGLTDIYGAYSDLVELVL